MGQSEGAFSRQFFPSVVSQRWPCRYGPWLSRFIASVAWRATLLRNEQPDPDLDFLTASQSALYFQAAETWRAFVLGGAQTPGMHELHFIAPSGVQGYQDDPTTATFIDRYTRGAVELDVAGCESEAFVYVKMGPVVAIGLIDPPPPDRWVGTRVDAAGGQMERTDAPPHFLDYYLGRAEALMLSKRRLSVRERERIRKALDARRERAAES